VELLGLLDGDDVAGLLHDADEGGVAAVVGADATLGAAGVGVVAVAGLGLGQVEAPAAEGDALLGGGDGGGQPEGVGALDLEEVEGDPLGRLGADAGEPSQLVDELLDGPRVGAAHCCSPRRPPSGPRAARWTSARRALTSW